MVFLLLYLLLRKEKKMKNYTKTSSEQSARTELHDKLDLTGAEISINKLGRGECVPFVHSHRENEEIYFILSGKGKASIDGENVQVSKGDWIRISPDGRRQFEASSDSGLEYICIQVREGSLQHYTATDAIVG